MSLPRSVAARASEATAEDDACVAAFQSQLDYVMRTVLRLGARPADIEDLAQEVFLALRANWLDFDRRRPLRPYLFGIAFRVVSSHRRKNAREVATGSIEAMEAVPDLSNDGFAAKEARAFVLAALEKIPFRRRAVFVMHELEDMSVAEVAKIVSVPPFTVYSRLRKARQEFESAIRRLVKEADRL